MVRPRITTPREILLVEIERRCARSGCGARNRIGLTKAEARVYHGFKCERCEEWMQDRLTERDAPEWWDELRRVSLRVAHPAIPDDEREDESR